MSLWSGLSFQCMHLCACVRVLAGMPLYCLYEQAIIGTIKSARMTVGLRREDMIQRSTGCGMM